MYTQRFNASSGFDLQFTHPILPDPVHYCQWNVVCYCQSSTSLVLADLLGMYIASQQAEKTSIGSSELDRTKLDRRNRP